MAQRLQHRDRVTVSNGMGLAFSCASVKGILQSQRLLAILACGCGGLVGDLFPVMRPKLDL